MKINNFHNNSLNSQITSSRISMKRMIAGLIVTGAAVVTIIGIGSMANVWGTPVESSSDDTVALVDTSPDNFFSAEEETLLDINAPVTDQKNSARVSYSAEEETLLDLSF